LFETNIKGSWVGVKVVAIAITCHEFLFLTAGLEGKETTVIISTYFFVVRCCFL
jgi:hypothetical protein